MSYLVDAMQDGTIDVDTLDAETVDVLVAELERRDKAYKSSLAERKRKAGALDPAARPTLRGKAVFIEPDVDVGDTQIRDAQRAHGWRKVGYEKHRLACKTHPTVRPMMWHCGRRIVFSRVSIH